MLESASPIDGNATATAGPPAQPHLPIPDKTKFCLLPSADNAVLLFIPGYGFYAPTFAHPEIASISLQENAPEAFPLTREKVLADVLIDWQDGSRCRFSQLPLIFVAEKSSAALSAAA